MCFKVIPVFKWNVAFYENVSFCRASVQKMIYYVPVEDRQYQIIITRLMSNPHNHQVPIVGSTVSHSQLKRSLHLFLHHVINTYQSSIFNLTLSSETTTLLQQCCI